MGRIEQTTVLGWEGLSWEELLSLPPKLLPTGPWASLFLLSHS